MNRDFKNLFFISSLYTNINRRKKIVDIRVCPEGKLGSVSRISALNGLGRLIRYFSASLVRTDKNKVIVTKSRVLILF